MDTYVVLYRQDCLSVVDAPFAFVCEADGTDHAEEQCENAYPDCDIVWVYGGSSVDEALSDYWAVSDFKEV